jgi:ubiquitin-like protein 5
MERRERGEVPARFGGTREQGVRNTMSSIAPQGNAPGGTGAGAGGTGHLRRGGDPLDRMPAKGPGGGGGEADRMMQERVAAMGGGAPPPTSGSTGPPSGIPT